MLKVRVPATSANLGPGFDCVGLALNLYNDLYFYKDKENNLPLDAVILSSGSFAHQGMNLVAETIGRNVPVLNVAIKASVPRSRGLGSSATLTVAGIVAANIILEADLSEEKIISLASKIEGHPDNAAPALIGGLVMSVLSGGDIKYIKIKPKKPLQFVVAVPKFELSTHIARKVVPSVVPHEDAVFNTCRFGLFMTSLIMGDYGLLNVSMEDRLHQPYRVSLVPGLKEVMAAANESGALGSCLSGAGPSILAFCDKRVEEIKKAMVDTWNFYGISSNAYLLDLSSEGLEYTQY